MPNNINKNGERFFCVKNDIFCRSYDNAFLNNNHDGNNLNNSEANNMNVTFITTIIALALLVIITTILL